jgi:hypothetical protein
MARWIESNASVEKGRLARESATDVLIRSDHIKFASVRPLMRLYCRRLTPAGLLPGDYLILIPAALDT